MTKSQNTKSEQHCIKQNEKSFTQKDLSLTELWQKGELPEGWYYTKIDMYEDGNIEIVPNYFNSKDFEWYFVIEVLAPVPNYDEWKQLEEFADYSIHNRDELTKQINFWMDENTKLKDLLKEIRSKIKTVYDFDTREFTECAEYDKSLVDKIDEVLK